MQLGSDGLNNMHRIRQRRTRTTLKLQHGAYASTQRARPPPLPVLCCRADLPVGTCSASFLALSHGSHAIYHPNKSKETCEGGPATECTKIAHRRSLAIFTAEEGITGNSAARIILTRFHHRKDRGSLAIFFAEEIAHLGASRSRAIFRKR